MTLAKLPRPPIQYPEFKPAQTNSFFVLIWIQNWILSQLLESTTWFDVWTETWDPPNRQSHTNMKELPPSLMFFLWLSQPLSFCTFVTVAWSLTCESTAPPAWIILFNGVWIFFLMLLPEEKSSKWVLEVHQELLSSRTYGFGTRSRGPRSLRDHVLDNGRDIVLECCPVLLFILYFAVFSLTVCEFISVVFKSCCFALGVIYKLCFKVQ